MKIATAVISLVQVAALVARGVDGNNKEASVANVPSFTVQELLLAQRDPELVSILTTTGLLTVSLDDNDDAFSSMDVLQGLCDCPDFLTIDGTDTVVLDGDTVRSTLATATVGTTTPLPLSDGVGTACGDTLQQGLEQVRDHVATASSAFTVALDRIMGTSTASSSARPLMRDVKHSNKVYPTVSSITASANHLEHFHIYEKGEQQSSEEKDKTLDWHTDAGLFLSFVPGQECGSGLTDDTFYFRNSEEEEVSAMFSANSVAIMLGVGAQHWIMSSSLPLKATQHAVQMTEGSKRVWYGMMHLVPETAIIQENPTKTFGDMRANMVLSSSKPNTYGQANDDDEIVSIGCGQAPVFANNQDVTATSSRRRRRLQHVPDGTYCNNVTNFFCWMSCLDIPGKTVEKDAYIREGYSLYCVDPGLLASSGNVVSKAMEPCIDRFSPNSDCLGSWQPTAPGVEPSAIVELSENSTDLGDQPYCWGGTSMYMDGFHWVHDTTCVIYLFPSWVLSSEGKLAAAAIGTILFGIALELVIMQRRSAMGVLKKGRKRLAATALFYGLQLTMGYFLMLVVMTYSGVLFFCTIIGIVTGHVLFNAKDALLFQNNQKTSSTTEHTMTEKNQETALDYTAGDCCNKSAKTVNGTTQFFEDGDDDDSNEGVPEGSTPCCQHVL